MHISNQNTGELLFFVSLILLIFSMLAAVKEIFISVDALTIELSAIEELKDELEEKGILKRIFHSDEK